MLATLDADGAEDREARECGADQDPRALRMPVKLLQISLPLVHEQQLLGEGCQPGVCFRLTCLRVPLHCQVPLCDLVVSARGCKDPTVLRVPLDRGHRGHVLLEGGHRGARLRESGGVRPQGVLGTQPEFNQPPPPTYTHTKPESSKEHRGRTTGEKTYVWSMGGWELFPANKPPNKVTGACMSLNMPQYPFPIKRAEGWLFFKAEAFTGQKQLP